MDKYNEVFRNKVISNWKLRSQPPEDVETPTKSQLKQPKSPPKRETIVLPAQKRPESPPKLPKRVYTVAPAPPSPVTPNDSVAKKPRTEPQTLKNKKRKLKKKKRLKEQPIRAKSIPFTYQPSSNKDVC